MFSREITEEISQNFIDSSYDTNTNRAFPDARDGLKPGQRACLWEMYKKGYKSDKPHVKSAKISGAVCAEIWPHGTTAIYETFVRMSQSFVNNIPEVDFHGSNGNQILGSDPAADRYTEARLASIVEEGMFQGIDKSNVDMILNFSEDQYWPSVLPSVFPRLLTNGAQGIGVSIANTWLPHNLQETSKLIIDYLETGEIDYTYTPDFPTGGKLVDISEVEKINRTGKGKVILEARGSLKGKEIQFTEFCYQTYIEPILEQIKSKIDDGTIKGIVSVDNKSDKDRLCLSITVSRTVEPKDIINQLYQYTDLRQTYSANQIAIVGKTPKLLNLKDMVDIYVSHNIECIRREFEFDYNKTKDRLEIVCGLIVCADNIDLVVSIIRNSKNSAEASTKLQSELNLTEAQAKAILDMRLAKLNSLEVDGIQKEKSKLEKYLVKCDKVRSSEKEQKKILVKRLSDLAEKFGTPRRTKISQKKIEKVGKQVTDVTVALDSDGYLKFADQKTQGTVFINTKSDALLHLFSNLGKMYRVSIRDISQGKGTALGSILNLDNEEYIMWFTDNCDEIAVSTTDGMGKRVSFDELRGTTRNLKGMPCIKLNDGQQVLYVGETQYSSPSIQKAKLMGKASRGAKITVDRSR